ncbi:class I SAM-dependent methyltransferase [Nocardia sp. NPDC088792]|uniref:class I SAM-dependent methyltransferase n=1 Tax=Nocardia sp. NPDC088792 TaxID=3364332 RepID=UPI00381C47A0
MSTDVGTIDWEGWLRRWDAQQEGYVPEREARFTAMFDVVAELLPTSFVAVDLGCGPGAISQRLLTRFSGARSVAVDIDPVMVALGRGALGTVDGRLRWVEADLASPDLLEAIGETQVDVVLSTTALHWLQPEALARLYRDLGRLLRSGGIFLNGDNLAYPAVLPTFDRLSHRVLEGQWSDSAFAERGIETAEQWWEALAEEPGFRSLIAERAQRFAGKQRPGRTDVDAHMEALSVAGFSEIGTIWQVLSNRVLLAVR